jgi:Bacterial DNA polymerase III alpha NTPase domain
MLNPGRKSMPDIDIDFSVAGRDRVINYVAEKYGRDRVAQIITFGTMRTPTTGSSTPTGSTSRRRLRRGRGDVGQEQDLTSRM